MNESLKILIESFETINHFHTLFVERIHYIRSYTDSKIIQYTSVLADNIKYDYSDKAYTDYINNHKLSAICRSLNINDLNVLYFFLIFVCLHRRSEYAGLRGVGEHIHHTQCHHVPAVSRFGTDDAHVFEAHDDSFEIDDLPDVRLRCARRPL